jgi:hypothetical protein
LIITERIIHVMPHNRYLIFTVLYTCVNSAWPLIITVQYSLREGGIGFFWRKNWTLRYTRRMNWQREELAEWRVGRNPKLNFECNWTHVSCVCKWLSYAVNFHFFTMTWAWRNKDDVRHYSKLFLNYSKRLSIQ